MNTALLILLPLIIACCFWLAWLNKLNDTAKQRAAALSRRISIVMSLIKNDPELEAIADKAAVIHILAEKPGKKGLTTALKMITASKGIYLKLLAFERTLGIKDQVFEQLSDEDKEVHISMEREMQTRQI